MKLETLRDLYVEELRDLYDAENQLLKALPKLAKAASSSELQAAFEDHAQLTEDHIDRLEQIFNQLGAKGKGKKCEGMKGLVSEGKEMIDQDAAPEVLDAGLIVAAQKSEHYEIAGYGSARTFAQTLGLEEQSDLLQQTLDEEEEMDERLSELAEQIINPDAAQEEADEDSEEEAVETNTQPHSEAQAEKGA